MSQFHVTAAPPSKLAAIEEKYFLPEAISLLRRLQKNGTELPDDEMILLIAAGQAALTEYIDPNNQAAEKMLGMILEILERRKLKDLTLRKLLRLLRDQRRRASLPAGQTMRRMHGLS